MSRKPVNGLNLELLTDLKNSLENAEKDGSKGIVLTSTLSTIFSGGLDIMEMYKPDDTRVEKFWTALQDAWITLYGLRIPTAAAINVHVTNENISFFYFFTFLTEKKTTFENFFLLPHEALIS